MKLLVISDNHRIASAFHELVGEILPHLTPDYACSTSGRDAVSVKGINFRTIHLASGWESIANRYDLILSLHCVQIFPPELVKAVRCVNVHPGFNPYNRGWYPHVFSIINGLPAGVTIHEMDEKIDHGGIIVQQQLTVEEHDTSGSLYEKILELEISLLREHLKKILDMDYVLKFPESEGNFNSRKDYEKLCRIDTNQAVSSADMIRLLRALSHEGYQNAHYIDSSGRKIFVEIKLQPENGTH